MSWSFSAIGKPEAVARSIENSNTNLTGQSLAEWEEVKPALLALVGGTVGSHMAVKVNASGHASFTNGEKTHGQCACIVESIYGFVE